MRTDCANRDRWQLHIYMHKCCIFICINVIVDVDTTKIVDMDREIVNYPCEQGNMKIVHMYRTK